MPDNKPPPIVEHQEESVPEPQDDGHVALRQTNGDLTYADRDSENEDEAEEELKILSSPTKKRAARPRVLSDYGLLDHEVDAVLSVELTRTDAAPEAGSRTASAEPRKENGSAKVGSSSSKAESAAKASRASSLFEEPEGGPSENIPKIKGGWNASSLPHWLTRPVAESVEKPAPVKIEKAASVKVEKPEATPPPRKPKANGTSSCSLDAHSALTHTCPPDTAAVAGPSKTPAKTGPAKTSARADEPFLISIEYSEDPESRTLFKTRGRHLVSKVLMQACRTFGIEEEYEKCVSSVCRSIGRGTDGL